MRTPIFRILLVDDDPEVLGVVQSTLASKDILVTACMTSMDGRDLALNEKFDLVLLDIGLPDDNGFTVLSAIRQNESTKLLPVIVLTARDSMDDKVRGFELGATDYVTKPFEVRELRARVRSSLRVKQLQDQLAEANRALETSRLSAEAATRAKSDFLAHMSHEIRTPMNGVIAMSRLLLETTLDDQQHDLARTIHTSADSLLIIINDILDFSKIEAGKLQLEILPFKLRNCLEETLDLLSSKAEEKGIDLSCHIEDSVPSQVQGDITRLRQILVNLVGNAIKFTAQGEVFVQVAAQKASDVPNKHLIHFSVRDTGVGIPSEKFDRLFKAFSQTDSSTTRQFGGTGLGLAISKSLVELMGGRIWVESTAGYGSTFHFTILVEPGPAMEEPESAPAGLAGMRLLIVDDNPTNRRILTLQARKWGMTSHDVVSAEETLVLLEQDSKFDAAILDMQMPNMDGATLAIAIRKKFPQLKLPLILFSSMGSFSEIPKDALAIFSSCLHKPIKPAQLFHALQQVRRGTKETQAMASPGPRLDSTLGSRFPMKILLVDDNAINQKVASRLLQQMGYSTDIAGNGIEAVNAARQSPYDLILMDLQMPEMDGLEATRRIRTMQQSGEITSVPRILAMTANVLQNDRAACSAAGMDDFVPKPIQPDFLQKTLERWGQQTLNERSSQPAPKPVASKSAPLPPIAPAVPRSSEPAVDLDRLKSFTDGTEENLVELVTLYLEQTAKQLDELEAAAAAKDVIKLKKIAHTGAGSSGTCGMMPLSTILREIERLCIENNFEAASGLCPQARKEFQQVDEILRKVLPL